MKKIITLVITLFAAIGMQIEAKDIVSTEETLTAVSVNGIAMDDDEFAYLLVWHNAGFPDEEFATAPTFVFTKHVVVRYDDSSVEERDENIEVVGTEDDMGDWSASAIIGGVEYSVYATIAISFTVTYMDGETLLGTESVAEAEMATQYGQYEAKEGYTFEGWYSDPALTTPIDLTTTPFFEDATVYAKFTETATAIGHAKEDMQATKTIRNGMLLIEQNGALLNTQGARLR